MAQTSKRPNSANRPNRPTGSNRTAPGAAKKAAGPAAAKTTSRPGPSGAGRPPARKPGKSIVNQKQTPWGLVAVAVVLVLFAGGIVAYAVTRHKDSPKSLYTQAELASVKKIPGVQYKVEPNHNHTTGAVKYDTSPPTGGNHNPTWALCDGVVYDHQIANENAVHMLEHGAVWITYNPKTIKAADLTKLKNYVNGVNYLALSPYAGLKTPISLQAWNYQLFLNSASDKRIDEFVGALKYPSSNTPEPGAGCTGSGFVASKSTLGHPYTAGA